MFNFPQTPGGRSAALASPHGRRAAFAASARLKCGGPPGAMRSETA